MIDQSSVVQIIPEIFNHLRANKNRLGDAEVDKAYHMITDLCQQIDQAYDVAFVAGTLTGFHESGLDIGDIHTFDRECVPASYSVQYHSNLTENMRKHALKRAKIKLHDVDQQIRNLFYPNYPDPTPRVDGFDYWLQDDEPLCDAAQDFFFDYIKDLIDQCIKLTEKKRRESDR